MLNYGLCYKVASRSSSTVFLPLKVGFVLIESLLDFFVVEKRTFLDALVSLGLMVVTDKLIYRLEIDSPSDSSESLRSHHSKWKVTENGLSLKWNVTQQGWHSKWNVTQKRMSLKTECHSKWNVTQMECYSKWNVTQNGMSLKMECHSKWNFTGNGMSLKMECDLKCNLA